MKFRTAILLGCLLIVPLLAMFSHKIPKDVRDRVRANVWQPIASRLSPWPEVGEATPSAPATAVAAVKEQTTSRQASPALKPQTRTGPAADVAATMTPEVLPQVAIPSTLVEGQSPRPPAAGEAFAAGTSAAEKLAGYGAVGLTVKRADRGGAAVGGPVVHVASCRVPVDASGQLQRLFQSTAPTAEESVERLVEQVAGWRSRLASSPQPSPPVQPRYQ